MTSALQMDNAEIAQMYKARFGTAHYVKVLAKYREMLKGETLENTAHTYQVVAQRYTQTPDTGSWAENTSYTPFTTELELFLDNYKSVEEH